MFDKIIMTLFALVIISVVLCLFCALLGVSSFYVGILGIAAFSCVLIIVLLMGIKLLVSVWEGEIF